MFFQGTLQEGIATALQQSKLIVSFVHDDGDESKQWEEMLAADDMESLLEGNAVVLLMQAGSQEATYLAAIYPLPKVPTIVVMKNNGQLADYIASGTSATDFVSRLRNAVAQNTAAPRPTQAPVPVATNAPVPRAAPAQPNKPIDKGKGKARAEPEAESGPTSSSKPSDEAKKASELFRQRKQGRDEERQRVLQQIENDKSARKARAEEERDARRAIAVTAEGDTDTTSWVTSGSGNARKHEFCALQIRLFDGSQVRTRLPSASTVRKDVRAFVDESVAEADGGRSRTGYTFRVVFPSRLIDDTEEDRTLEELGLTPSATLILVQKETAATAYDDVPGMGGFFGRIYAAIAHFFAMIALFFTTVWPGAPRAEGGDDGAQRPQQQPAPTRQQRGQTLAQGSSGNKVRGLQDVDDQRDYQLYNGNSLNFEPRKDEKDNAEESR